MCGSKKDDIILTAVPDCRNWNSNPEYIKLMRIYSKAYLLDLEVDEVKVANFQENVSYL